MVERAFARIGRTATALWLLCSLTACDHRSGTWEDRAAAYLDQREAWWQHWQAAARDRHTFCISCHTSLAYALARPALRDGRSVLDLTTGEQDLLADVSKRVRMWETIRPYYPSQLSASRATEAILNALILSSYDARRGHLGEDTEAALRSMWSLQETTGVHAGSWSWVEFKNEPWEAYDSRYYGATLAALAVGMAPDDYRSRPEIRSALEQLRAYLVRDYATQTPINQVMLLWASSYLPRLLDPAQKRSIIRAIWSNQRPDGGWCLASLVGAWKRRDGTSQVDRSDGYATGLIALTVQDAGIPADDFRLRRALAWLAANQSRSGHWWGYSLNKDRNRLLDDAALFMDDAATAYAVLALTHKRHDARTGGSLSSGPS